MNKNKIVFKRNTRIVDNIADKYLIGERLNIKIVDVNNNQFFRSIPIFEFNRMIGNSGDITEVIAKDYNIFIIPKPLSEGECDTSEHKHVFVDSEDKDTQNVLYC